VSPGDTVIVALVLGGAVVLLAWAVFHAGRIERRAVGADQRLLPNHTREGLGHSFVGEVHGVPVRLRLTQRSGRSGDAGLWTEVHVPVPPAVTLELRSQDVVEAHLVAS
jgi:hypothetical protein